MRLIVRDGRQKTSEAILQEEDLAVTLALFHRHRIFELARNSVASS
jgi:hypothetical protein